MRPQRYFDWQSIVAERGEEPAENTRKRVRWILGFFALAAAAVLGRAVQLEISDGSNFRRLAARPIERRVPLPAPRGRILARDGALLAGDRPARALAVQYRYLERPPDAAWLSRMARARLGSADRRKPDRVAAAEAALRAELVDLERRLARLCDLTDDEWQSRAARIERRVATMAQRVNGRRLEGFLALSEGAESQPAELNVASLLQGLFAPPDQVPPPPIVIVEQTVFHHMVDNITADVAAEIESHPERWPGVKIVEHVRRDYPRGSLAAHVVGQVARNSMFGMDARPGNPEVRGMTGLELGFEDALAGRAGLEIRQSDRRGNLLACRRAQEPLSGGDITLSIDATLQGSAETWLDRRLRGDWSSEDLQTTAPQGGAILVMDVQTGELLVAASSPRFDPNWFSRGDQRVESLLNDPRRPLFDRAMKMAIPPGSVFKPLTAFALIENNIVDPRATFRCQGYLDDPDRLRCQIFRQHGVGHGELALADALAQSCNVYFCHHAPQLGPAPLVDWARRFGFGQPTGIELDESSGRLPEASETPSADWTQLLSIGQGPLTVTPLQIARMYAAIANGGYLVTPRVVKLPQSHSTGTPQVAPNSDPPGQQPAVERTMGVPIPGLSARSLAAVREGLRRVVEDPNGTAYAAVRLPWLSIAGKTGTAEAGREQADHAWFAGYAPADDPRWAFVVVLEHGGSGAEAAGSLARTLLVRMRELGYFGDHPTAHRPIPPGKG